MAPGVARFPPSIAERGIGGPAVSFLLGGGSDVSSVKAGFGNVLVKAVHAEPRHGASGAGGHALVARSRGRLTLVFGGEWAHARHLLQLLL